MEGCVVVVRIRTLTFAAVRPVSAATVVRLVSSVTSQSSLVKSVCVK